MYYIGIRLLYITRNGFLNFSTASREARLASDVCVDKIRQILQLSTNSTKKWLGHQTFLLERQFYNLLLRLYRIYTCYEVCIFRYKSKMTKDNILHEKGKVLTCRIIGIIRVLKYRVDLMEWLTFGSFVRWRFGLHFVCLWCDYKSCSSTVSLFLIYRVGLRELFTCWGKVPNKALLRNQEGLRFMHRLMTRMSGTHLPL